MALVAVAIRPTEGKVAVKFVDEDEGEGAIQSAATPMAEPVPYEGVLAVIVAVGDKVKLSKGDTVVMRPWARSGLKLGDNLFICDAYDVVATIDQ